MKITKDNKGITIIALVLTIVILIILAGVSINLVLGQDGLINRAQESEIKYIKEEIKEEIELAIIDIQVELVENNGQESLLKQEIINQLPNKIENIIITDELIGEYKDYEYWIDEEYKVHVGDRANGIMKSTLKVKVGTTYLTTTVTASSTQGNIIGYIYLIDGVETDQKTSNTYTVENLEEKSKHTIKAIAIDEKGNKKETQTVTIKTDSRTYLFKRGVDNIEITGGWQAIAKMTQVDAGRPTTTPILTIDTNINAHVNAHNSAGFWGGCITTKNKIDMTDYKYLYINYTATLGRYSGASVVQYTYDNDEKYLSSGKYLCYKKAISNQTEQIDVSQDNIEYRPGIYLQTSEKSGNASITIHEMWLEK